VLRRRDHHETRRHSKDTSNTIIIARGVNFRINDGPAGGGMHFERLSHGGGKDKSPARENLTFKKFYPEKPGFEKGEEVF